jgi:peptidoglycan/LPS O-acetylase OafA/YrhL
VTAARPARLEGLDALRGLAAMAVVLYHFTTGYDLAGPRHAAPGVAFAFTHGNYGVELFFIISGFVIFMTLERTATARDFAVSRASRLYPAFFASLAATLLVGYGLGLPTGQAGAWQILANLTMVPQLFGFECIDAAYWSLMYEWVFYALACIAVIGLGARAPELPCLAWIAAAEPIWIWTDRGGPWHLGALSGACYAHLFVIGIMLCRIRAGRARGLTWLVLATALAVSWKGPHFDLVPLGQPGYSALILGFTVLVWFAAGPRGGVLAVAPLRFLGRISYPFYLVHQLVGFAVMWRLEGAGVTPGLALLAAVAITVLLAWAISRSIEWPAQRWLRARLGPGSMAGFAPSVPSSGRVPGPP